MKDEDLVFKIKNILFCKQTFFCNWQTSKESKKWLTGILELILTTTGGYSGHHRFVIMLFQCPQLGLRCLFYTALLIFQQFRMTICCNTMLSVFKHTFPLYRLWLCIYALFDVFTLYCLYLVFWGGKCCDSNHSKLMQILLTVHHSFCNHCLFLLTLILNALVHSSGYFSIRLRCSRHMLSYRWNKNRWAQQLRNASLLHITYSLCNSND